MFDGGVDGFLLESINNWEEAEVALDGVKHFKKNCTNLSDLPVYLCMEGALRLLFSTMICINWSIWCVYRADDRVPAPEKLASVYAKHFLKYFDDNPTLEIKCFGLNCASPEALLDSLGWIFKENNNVIWIDL